MPTQEACITDDAPFSVIQTSYTLQYIYSELNTATTNREEYTVVVVYTFKNNLA